jgi:hypothetical protein
VVGVEFGLRLVFGLIAHERRITQNRGI